MSVVLVAGLTSGSVAATSVPASADSAPLSSTASRVSAPGTTASINPTVSTKPAASADAATLSTAAKAASMVGCTMPTKAGEKPVCPTHGTAAAMPSFRDAKPTTSGPAVWPATSSGDWTQFGHDASHSGDNASESTISTTNVASLGVAWTGTTGAPIYSSPAVANGLVYVGSADGKLYAYAIGCASGGAACTPLWTATTTTGYNVESSPAVA